MPKPQELKYQSADDRKYERGPKLRKMFGPSQAEIWDLLAQQVGGEFKQEAWWKTRNRVDAKVGQWTVTLDTYAVSTGKVTIVFTRLRAPYVNRDGFRFTITRANIFSPIARKLGFQDVQIGDKDFDKAFVVKSNDESRVKTFLADPALRAQLSLQPKLTLSVLDDEGFFGTTFPAGVDELKFHTAGIIKDLVRLQQLFELFAATLNRLCHIGSAYEDDPKIPL
jgi:hypothetical protein